MPFFPIKPEDTNVINENDECCMCNEKHLNGKLPDIVCENSTCESCFHTECLYQMRKLIIKMFFTPFKHILF